MEKKYCIYKHTNKINGKVYIGQTCQTPQGRWGKDGKNYLSHDTKFARAIKKYGWDNFWHEIIEENIDSIEKSNERETFWIIFYNSVEQGYNSNYGGDNHIPSQEVIEKYKQRTGEKNGFYGHHHSEELKQEMRELFGKPVICLETGKEYDSATYAGELLGICGGNIRSACRRGINVKIGIDWFHFYYKNEPLPVFIYPQERKVYNIETNEIFPNLIKAGESINKTSKLVGMCCRGKIQTAGGYHWAYYDNWNNATEKEKNEIQNQNLKGIGRKKKVKCVETNIVYNSQLEASRLTGIGQQSISRVVNGKQSTAGGYHWELVE